MLPLRILHVTPYSERAWAYGGIPRVVAALAHAQAQNGHRVTVATTDVRDATSRLLPSAGPSRQGPWLERSDDGVEWHVFPNRSNTLASRWQFYQPTGLSRFLRAAASRFDVAHLHACHNLLTARAARVLRAAGVPYVVQPNGTARRIEQRQALKALFDRLFEARLLERAAAVIAVSDWERAQLQEAGVASAAIHVVPNPLGAAPTLPPTGGFRARLGLTTAPVVLFLGALSPRKHPATLARAVAALDGPVQLVFAGADRGAAATTRRIVKRTGIASRTRFAGVLEGDARFAALADADVVVYASSDEAFGLVALEALQVGTPVVVGCDAGCAELIAALGGGLAVPPGDVEALTTAIGQVLRDPVRWRDQARRAGAAAQERFCPGAVSARVEAVYRAVATRAEALP
jgi:glycosyltransferase involved in cell wall biosynthesis